MLVDDRGYTVGDRTFTYTIEPPEYNALSADIDFFTKDANNLESWNGYLTCDQKQGTGTKILSGGEASAVTMKHFAEVVLNWGTDLEIRGKREPLMMAQLNIKTDDAALTDPVDEIKFSDGSKPNKRYRLELKSADLGPSCSEAADLAGTIKTILKSGQTATVSGVDFNPTQYPLSLIPPTNGCKVQVNGKLNFIVSNRSKTDLYQLATVLPDTAVLYGGLGNTELIELSDARKEVPIEPVGVIVLAIDGLRQDVLYPPIEQQVYPPNILSPYYIQPTELKGLCDVLGGKQTGIFSTTNCDTLQMDSKHIKLKNVTTIFPSITFAAWASIFTGKQPGQLRDDNGKVIDEGLSGPLCQDNKGLRLRG